MCQPAIAGIADQKFVERVLNPLIEEMQDGEALRSGHNKDVAVESMHQFFDVAYDASQKVLGNFPALRMTINSSLSTARVDKLRLRGKRKVRFIKDIPARFVEPALDGDHLLGLLQAAVSELLQTVQLEREDMLGNTQHNASR